MWKDEEDGRMFCGEFVAEMDFNDLRKELQESV
jgi:hypothetical protein